VKAVDVLEDDPEEYDEREQEERVIQARSSLAVLDDDHLDDVRDVLAAVDRDLDK
jgi:hypothetical protein